MLRTPSPVRRRTRAERLTRRVPFHMGQTALLLFLERVHPFSAQTTSPFIPFEDLQKHPFFHSLDSGVVSWVAPNPWVAIPAETWPFSIRTDKDIPLDVDVWPLRARHDSKRWIRSTTPGAPLTTFSVQMNSSGELTFQLDSYLDFLPASLASAEGEDCLARIRMEESLWDTCWRNIMSESVTREEFAEALFMWSHRNRLPVALPSVPIKVRLENIRRWMKVDPGIEEEHPLAVAALTGWDAL